MMKTLQLSLLALKNIPASARLLLICAGLIVLAFRCTERQRANPLDPNNPNTLGKPQGVQVLSKIDTVFLSWQRSYQNNINAYKIYRTQYPSGKIEKYIEIPGTTAKFIDQGVALGKTYTYQIASMVLDYESPPSEPVTITPGPTYTWVIDGGTSNILKLTHDCQHLVFKKFLSSYPEFIAINPYSGAAWILDDYSNLIYALNAQGELLFNKNKYMHPEMVDIHWKDGSAWLLDKTNNIWSLNKIAADGIEIFSFSALRQPKGISVVQNTNNCWVADAQLKKVILVKTVTGTEEIKYNFVSPQAVALHQQNGNLWVADSSSVLIFDYQGKNLLSRIETANFAYLLAVNQNNGDCWVVGTTSVSKYDLSGKTEFIIQGFYYPLSLSVNSYDGSCVVVDRDPSRLVRITKDGSSVTQISLVTYPTSVSVQNQYN